METLTMGSFLFKLWASGLLVLLFATCPSWNIKRAVRDLLWSAMGIWLAAGGLIGGITLLWFRP